MLSALEPDAPRGESTAMALSRPSSPPAPLAAAARAVAPDAPIDVDGEAAHLKHGLRAVAALDDAPPAFFVGSTSIVAQRVAHWQRLLPRVTPFYAVKANPNPTLVATLAALGVNFDCASPNEIALVRSLDVAAERIVYANPCKQAAHVRYALDKGVVTATFDNLAELHKLLHVQGKRARVVLRLLVDDSSSIMPFGSKFGASHAETCELLDEIVRLDADLHGFSFHVGSGCQSADAFVAAIRLARAAFDEAQRRGLHPTLLDIGGGFSGGTRDEVLPFETVARAIAPVLDELFEPSVTVIAEPGRYFATAAFALSVSVTAMRVRERKQGGVQRLNVVSSAATDAVKEAVVTASVSSGEREVQYYLADGVYGSFNSIIFDHQHPVPRLLFNEEFPVDAPLERATLFGPTCDSIDVVARDVPLPRLAVGDRLWFEAMGAYTSTAASTFNGIDLSPIFFMD